MTNIETIRLKQFVAVSIVVGFALGWAIAEGCGSFGTRSALAVCTILASVHLGWRFEHDRTRNKRADATWVAFYGKGLLVGDGISRLKSVFEAFVERAQGKEFDRFGCTKLLLSEEVSKELFAFLREQKNASTTTKPLP